MSPLQFGAMSIGDAWGARLGENGKENSFKMLDAFYEAGGVSIDTANNYQVRKGFQVRSAKWCIYEVVVFRTTKVNSGLENGLRRGVCESSWFWQRSIVPSE